MEGVGWLVLVISGFLALVLCIMIVAFVIAYVQRRMRPSDLRSQESLPRTPHLAVILTMWVVVIAQILCQNLGNDKTPEALMLFFTAIGVFLVTRDDRAAIVNGALGVLIFLHHILSNPVI